MKTRSLVSAALLLSGCALRHHPAVAPAPAHGPTTDSLFRVDQARGDSVRARGVIDGTLADFAPEVVYLRPGAPAVFSRESARGVMLSALGGRDDVVTWEPLGGDVANDLSSGYTFGVAARSGARGGVVRIERYVAFWRRFPGQPWRIVGYAEIGPSAGLAGDAPMPGAESPPVPRTLTKPLDRQRTAIRTADSVFADLAYRTGTAAAFAAVAAGDGAVVATPVIAYGPTQIRALYEASGRGAFQTWKPVFADVAGSGELGFTVGEYIATGRGPSGAAVQRFGKYLTVWRLQADGTWKFVVEGGNLTR